MHGTALNAAFRQALLTDPGLQNRLDEAWGSVLPLREAWTNWFPGSEHTPPAVGAVLGHQNEDRQAGDVGAGLPTRITMTDRALGPRLRQLLQPGGATDKWLRLTSWPQAQDVLIAEAQRVAAPRGLLLEASRLLLLKADVVVLAADRPSVALTQAAEDPDLEDEGDVQGGTTFGGDIVHGWTRLRRAAVTSQGAVGSQEWEQALRPVFGTAAQLYAQVVTPEEVRALDRECLLRQALPGWAPEAAQRAIDAWYPGLVRAEQLGLIVNQPLSMADVDQALARHARDSLRHPAYTTRRRAADDTQGQEDLWATLTDPKSGPDEVGDEAARRVDNQRLFALARHVLHLCVGAGSQPGSADIWQLLDDNVRPADGTSLRPEGDGGPVAWDTLLALDPQACLSSWPPDVVPADSDPASPAPPASRVNGARAAVEFLDWVSDRLADGEDLSGDGRSWSVLHRWMAEERDWARPTPAANEKPNTARQRLARSIKRAADGEVVWALGTLLPLLLALNRFGPSHPTCQERVSPTEPRRTERT